MCPDIGIVSTQHRIHSTAILRFCLLPAEIQRGSVLLSLLLYLTVHALHEGWVVCEGQKVIKDLGGSYGKVVGKLQVAPNGSSLNALNREYPLVT